VYLEYENTLVESINWWDGKVVWVRCNKTLDFLHSTYYHYTQIDPRLDSKLSFHDFQDLMSQYEKGVTENRYLIHNPYDKPWYKRFDRPYYGANVVKVSYRRKAHHEKKVLTFREECDREWKRQFSKDKSWRSRRTLKSTKEAYHRKERSRVREMIHNGDWDNWINVTKNDVSCSWDFIK
jgi:hypothetical protein